MFFFPASFLFSFFLLNVLTRAIVRAVSLKVLTLSPVTYLFWIRRCEFSYYVRLTWITPQSRWCSHFLEFSEIGFLLTEVVKTSLDEIQVTPFAQHSIYFVHLLRFSLYVIGLFKSWSIYCSYLDDVARSSSAIVQRL
jgi:hypothetical protein